MDITADTDWEKIMADSNPLALCPTDFEKAIIGVAVNKGALVYVISSKKCVERLKMSMSEEDAWEYFDYNIAGNYMGNNTPYYV